jgi:hypothetical protein
VKMTVIKKEFLIPNDPQSTKQARSDLPDTPKNTVIYPITSVSLSTELRRNKNDNAGYCQETLG